MRVKHVVLFNYDELSDKAKEKARDWYREVCAGDTFFAEYITDTLAPDAAKFLGIKFNKPRHERNGLAIYWSGFSSQGDGASFEGTWTAANVDAVGLKKEFPQDKELHRIADEMAAVAAKLPEATAQSDCRMARYNHSGTMRVSVESPDGGDSDGTQFADDVEQLLRDFADWIYACLESEYKYVNSDECVVESIEANGYEFTQDGALA